MTPIIHTPVFATIASPPRQHLDVVVEAVQSCIPATLVSNLESDRICSIHKQSNLPQLTQTAYQHGVSCADATFSCQETISKYIRDGDSVYSCFYDLASAFDSGIPRPSQPSEEFRYIREGLAPHEGLVQGWALICPCGQNNLSCLRRQSRGPSRLSSLPYPLSTRHGSHPPRAQE